MRPPHYTSQQCMWTHSKHAVSQHTDKTLPHTKTCHTTRQAWACHSGTPRGGSLCNRDRYVCTHTHARTHGNITPPLQVAVRWDCANLALPPPSLSPTECSTVPRHMAPINDHNNPNPTHQHHSHLDTGEAAKNTTRGHSSKGVFTSPAGGCSVPGLSAPQWG